MQQPFQKPENALRRADELESIGQPEAALQVLHSAIGHKKFKSAGWDNTHEQLLLRYGKLCVDLEKLRLAREGLHLYRAISTGQTANAGSLGKVIGELRDQAERRMLASKELLADDELKKSLLNEDLEAAENPERIMLATLHADVRNAVGQKVHSALRFAWEIYKMILDVLRTTPKLEKVYHETAIKAFHFCRDNTRHQEFKRLCEVLRTHYILLMKLRGKQETESLLRPELHLETRIIQLQVACDLKLWREACATSEDIYNLGLHELFVRSSTDPFRHIREKVLRWLAIYYDKMAQILWVSDNQLFHALAVLKYLLHVKTFKKTVSAHDLQMLSSAAVFAVLSIPVGDKRFRDSTELGTLTMENQKKLTSMLGHPTVPCRDFLKNALAIKDILDLSLPLCRKFYDLLNNDFVPLQLCSNSVPLIEELSEQEPNLEQYVKPLKRIIFHKLVNQLATVYKTLRIDYFTSKICPAEFLPWSEAEKMIVNLVHEGQVEIRIDYVTKAIRFGSVGASATSALKLHLASVGCRLTEAVSLIEGSQLSFQSSVPRTEKEVFLAGLTEQHQRIKRRNKENEIRRKQKHDEQLRVLEDRRKMVEQQRVFEERAEVRRREEALKRREETRMREEKFRVKSETAKLMLDEIKKMSGHKVLIKGKQIDDIKVTDVLDGNVVYEDIEKAQEQQRLRACMERVRLRRAEAKRMDHFIRACREEELSLLKQWADDTLQSDTATLAQLQAEHEEAQNKEFEDAMKLKKLFLQYEKEKDSWVAANLNKAEGKKNLSVSKANKIGRARQRFLEAKEENL